MNRRAFLKAGATTTALLLSRPAWCRAEEKAKPTDDEILAQTNARIEQHRKGDGVITVRNKRGKMMRGARIKVEQLGHDFRFGSNFFMFGRCGKPELEEQYRARFEALLNYCTLGFYWAGYERERGKPGYSYTDEVVAWTREHRIPCKGHPLVWDHPAGSPGWLPDDPKEIELLSTTRVREIISRYQGRIDIWDVGIQSHMHDRVWPLQKVWDTCDTYSQLGLPLHFTESTIVSGPRKGPGEHWGETTAEGEARQAELTASFYTALFAHPAVQGITWWDFSDLGAWQGAPAGWLRRDMSPKPAYERLMGLIKGEWWTKTETTTDARGQAKLRAFYGHYRITAQARGGQPVVKEVQLERGKQNQFDLTI